MHIDAFYEYLLDNPHPYWTEIPATPDPVREGGRDGVAAEDDMALRSLLPHIRPRRGRKRPEEGSMSRSPSQRPKMDDASSSGGGTMEQIDFWAPHPDACGNDYLFAPQDQFSRVTLDMTHTSASPWTPGDFVHTPISAHSYAAHTPVATTSTLWVEQQKNMSTDSHLAATSTSSKQNRRHGAKVVSSAWRAGGPGGSGKTRGRPPLKRQNNSRSESQGPSQVQGEISPFSAFQAHRPRSSTPPSRLGHITPQTSSSSMPTAIMSLGTSIPTETITSAKAHTELSIFDMQTQHHNAHRDHRTIRGRLALQVPERLGGDVRIGAPYSQHEGIQPPIVMIDGMVARGQPSVFPPHDLARPGVDVMDPFAEPTHNLYLSLDQQQRQLEHDPRLQTVPQGTSSLHSEVSGSEDLTEGSIQLPFHPGHQQQQQMIQLPAPVPSTSSDLTGLTIGSLSGVTYKDITDRTNLDAVESLLTYTLLDASWHDDTGKAIPACEVDEAVAIASELVETVRKGATSQEAFVSNISTLAGTTFLKNPEGPTVRVYRVVQKEDSGKAGDRREVGRAGETVYDIHWDLRLGDIGGGFHLRERVSHLSWRDRKRRMGSGSQHVHGAEGETDQNFQGSFEEERAPEFDEAVNWEAGLDGGDGDEAERWRRKYQALLGVVQQQNSELSEIRKGVLKTGRSLRQGRH